MRRMRLDRRALLALVLGVLLTSSAAALAEEPAHTGHGAPATQEPAATQEVAGHETAPAEAPAHGEGHAAVAAHGEGHGEAHGEGGHGGHGGMPHIPSALTFIEQGLAPEQAAKLDSFKDPIFSILVSLILAVFFVSLSRKLDARRPGRAQMAVELLFGGLYSLFHTIIGPSARKYTPFLGSLFVFIFCNNLFGMVPLGHSSTSSFANTTFALGMLTFLYVQGIALKENGIGGWLFHMAGSPRSGMEWGFSLLLFPLHVLGELIKPISLSLRLFGNIFGEDTLMATMVLLGAGIMFNLTGHSPFVPGLPLQVPFYFLGLLSCTIQALVFTLLATVYIALWLPHGHHEEGHHGDEHGHGAHAAH